MSNGILWHRVRDGIVHATCRAPDLTTARAQLHPTRSDVVISAASLAIPMHPAIEWVPLLLCSVCSRRIDHRNASRRCAACFTAGQAREARRVRGGSGAGEARKSAS